MLISCLCRYVTLTAIGSPPATNAFLRVRPIAPIDVDEHRSGRGAGAVCIAPMRGDVYAPMMKDHISVSISQFSHTFPIFFVLRDAYHLFCFVLFDFEMSFMTISIKDHLDFLEFTHIYTTLVQLHFQ